MLVKQFLSSVAISANINSAPFILPPISSFLTPLDTFLPFFFFSILFCISLSSFHRALLLPLGLTALICFKYARRKFLRSALTYRWPLLSVDTPTIRANGGSINENSMVAEKGAALFDFSNDSRSTLTRISEYSSSLLAR